ncbi:uracil-DNA glycosylase family protein [Aneurinibacillus tyrosinisolvens]|uniref:uracil-DNA glycosylase family protein n=1 Tax=Aneurinibacillus tyrosinisolvens TaxID=1443435 RepID=UPI00069C6DE1|nr:uracil-DNA glycosylase family protein [Aneurinibacillus tyrosinisolvens]
MLHINISNPAELISALPHNVKLTKGDLLTEDFLLYKNNGLEIYYAPFDYTNETAKVVIVGITPGWNEMEISFRQVRAALSRGLSFEQACKLAKQQAAFVGSTRKNLCEMLDDLGLPAIFTIENSQSLFHDNIHLLDATSVIRYPVFIHSKNYTGHSPNLLKTPILRQFAVEIFSEEIKAIKDALIIPLGSLVTSALELLIEQGMVKKEQCLLGFPHPSGANRHRKKQYEKAKPELKTMLLKNLLYLM